MRVLPLLAILLIVGCVKTTRTSKPMIVTTYQYNNVWILDCLSKPEADTIIRIVSAQTPKQILKISYSAEELMKLKGNRNYTLPCDRVDVFTAADSSGRAAGGTAYKVEKKNNSWIVKGSYKWSM
jgi:hypothetical protein